MIGYGVFCEDMLIFNDEMSYAIYENDGLAADFMYEMHRRFPHTVYNVRPIELNLKAVYGDFYRKGYKKMTKLTEDQVAAGNRIPPRIWNHMVMAMFKAPYLNEDAILKELANLSNVIADEIDNIKDRVQARFEVNIVTKHLEESIAEPTIRFSSYLLGGLHSEIPLERVEFCCKYLEGAVMDLDSEDITLAFTGFKRDKKGYTFFAECPFCGAKLDVDGNGMTVKGMGEC